MRTQQQPAPITLLDIVSAVFRYKGRFLLVSLLTLTVAVLVVLLLPKKFESEAKLFVRLGRSSTGVDPATMGPTISIQDSRETEVNSIIDLLQSRGLAEEIVNRIGEDRICEKTAWLDRQMENLTGWIGALVPEEDTSTAHTSSETVISKGQEAAIKEFMGNLRIHSPKKSTTLSVVYRASSPETARDVVAAVVQVFQDLHIRSNVSDGAVEFFTTQFADENGRLANSESEFRALKNEAGILSLAGARDSLQAEQSNIKLQLLQANADYSAAVGRVDELKLSMKFMPEILESETTAGIEAGASDAMRDRLYELEIREKELSAKFLENHPDLIKVRAQLADARKILDSQPKEREHKVTAVNPVLIEMRKELFVAEANAASLKTRLDSLQKLDADLLARLEKLNTLEVTAERLQREINIGRDNHQIYARKLEEARINAALNQEALSNVSVVAEPSIRFAHTSPKRSMLAVVALAFAGLAGLFVALASEYFARTKDFARAQDMGEQLQVSHTSTTGPAQSSRGLAGRMETDSRETSAQPLPR